MSRVLKTGENQITNGYSSNHIAVDLVKKTNQLDTIIAHSAGTVVMVQTGYRNNKGSTGNASYGNMVKIKHDNGYYTLYAHLRDVYVKKGQRVSKGQEIGYMGNSGNAYGAHLHFEVRNEKDVRINPTPYINANLPSSNSESKPTGVQYRVHLKGGSWLSWVTKADSSNEGYAGIYGREIDGIQVKNKKYQAHTLNGSWLSIVNKVDESANGYAGIWGQAIDGIKVYDAQYRVHVKAKGNLKAEWLPWVSKVDGSNEGYAGYIGREIDGIQIK